MNRVLAAVLITICVMVLLIGFFFYISKTDRQDVNMEEKAHLIEQYFGGDTVIAVITATGGFNDQTGLYEYEFLCQTRTGGQRRCYYSDKEDLTTETIGKLYTK